MFEAITSNLLIPFAFFFLIRKLIGLIVEEKEVGMKLYLKINGCSSIAYNLSFIIAETILVLGVINYHLNLLIGMRSTCNAGLVL